MAQKVRDESTKHFRDERAKQVFREKEKLIHETLPIKSDPRTNDHKRSKEVRNDRRDSLIDINHRKSAINENHHQTRSEENRVTAEPSDRPREPAPKDSHHSREGHRATTDSRYESDRRQFKESHQDKSGSDRDFRKHHHDRESRDHERDRHSTHNYREEESSRIKRKRRGEDAEADESPSKKFRNSHKRNDESEEERDTFIERPIDKNKGKELVIKPNAPATAEKPAPTPVLTLDPVSNDRFLNAVEKKVEESKTKAAVKSFGIFVSATTHKVALYARVSTHKQEGEGYSLETQVSDMMKFCEAKNLQVTLVFKEVCSGKVPPMQRDKFKEMIQSLRKREVHGMVFHRVDRAARSSFEMQNIARMFDQNRWIFSCSNQHIGDNYTPEGKLQFNVIAGVAEFERDMIANRVKEAMAGKRERYEVSGTLPWGATWQAVNGRKMLAVHPEEFKIIQLVLEWRQEHTVNKSGNPRPTTRKVICERLTQLGYKQRACDKEGPCRKHFKPCTVKGHVNCPGHLKCWGDTQIKRIEESPVYHDADKYVRLQGPVPKNNKSLKRLAVEEEHQEEIDADKSPSGEIFGLYDPLPRNHDDQNDFDDEFSHSLELTPESQRDPLNGDHPEDSYESSTTQETFEDSPSQRFYRSDDWSPVVRHRDPYPSLTPESQSEI